MTYELKRYIVTALPDSEDDPCEIDGHEMNSVVEDDHDNAYAACDRCEHVDTLTVRDRLEQESTKQAPLRSHGTSWTR